MVNWTAGLGGGGWEVGDAGAGGGVKTEGRGQRSMPLPDGGAESMWTADAILASGSRLFPL